jgi:hypothetical protein
MFSEKHVSLLHILNGLKQKYLKHCDLTVNKKFTDKKSSLTKMSQTTKNQRTKKDSNQKILRTKTVYRIIGPHYLIIIGQH